MQRRLLVRNDNHEKLIMPGVRHFTVKNNRLEYINDLGNTAELLGFRQENDILGQTDYDVKTPVKELAHIFEQQDRHSLTSKQAKINLTVSHYSSGLSTLLSHKQAINGEELAINVWHLPTNTLKLIGISPQLELRHSKRINCTYTVTRMIENLSEQESLTLFFILRGLSAKSIGARTQKSSRTIEKQIIKIRHKFSCTNTQQLIELNILLKNNQFLPALFLPSDIQNLLSI